jgi:hypothetical protein
MAARFWVGGTATWDSTTTTYWSATSGGAGGASVPTSADDVTIDSLSGTPTVTTNYNVSVNTITINAAGATLALGGTLTSTGAITLSIGTFTTNNYAVTASQLASSTSSSRTINLGSSTITFTSIGVTIISITNLTFNAGTSNIVMNTTAMSLGTVGLTYYNVSFTSTTVTSHSISGNNTFNNLTVTAPSSVGVTQLLFSGNQTINGVLSTTGTAGNQRVWFQSATYGLQYTLTVNGSTSLTDADFRDIIVQGTAAPISGTRIGNLRGCLGITFSTPKTVYWNLAGSQTWSANGWAATSGGTPNTNNFPLAQDTAVFNNTGSVTGTITMDGAIPYTGTVDMSARTSAMSIGLATTQYIYGDWKNGSGITFTGTAGWSLVFSGRNTQTLTSAGISFSIISIETNSYGGTLQLADAFTTGAYPVVVTNGTFTTNGYAVTASYISSTNSNVRTINLNSSTVTLSDTANTSFLNITNLTFNAGTSNIVFTAGTTGNILSAGGITFYNVSITYTGSGASPVINGSNNIFNNLSIASPAAAGITILKFNGNNTINGTLTCAGSDAVHRIFLQSATLGTQRTLTVNSLSGNNCDFRDIKIAGTAAGTSLTGAGDCGGNLGITFPVPKTVYWNLAGTQNWEAVAWATSSGGTPALANFPLAQDTAVFDNSSAGTQASIGVTWNFSTINASTRTTAFTIVSGLNITTYGSVTFGSGLTFSVVGTLTFSGRGTSTITSAGKTFGTTGSITIDCITGTVQLADDLNLSNGFSNTLTVSSGIFDAVSYNVTMPQVSGGGAINTPATIKMGTGLWTLNSPSSLFNVNFPYTTVYKNTANILFSDGTGSNPGISAGGNNVSFNKITIGGTGSSNFNFNLSAPIQLTELASTRTTAYAIIMPSNSTLTVGKWSVTGSAGNLVTLGPSAAATAYTLSIAGAAPSGIDYLSISYCTLSATSPAEFFVGANSVNTAGNTNVTFTATPAARTLYWVGGTGNWSSTTSWSTSSGGASGAAIPTSLDSVTFDTLSNATAYTATVDPTQARCASLTIGAPALGALTFAGTGGLAIAGNTSIAASNVTRTFTGAITLSGASSYTFTTNGVALASTTEVNGVGCSWTMGSAPTFGGSMTITNGTFDTGNYALSVSTFNSTNTNSRTINLGSSTVTITGGFVTFTISTNLTFNCGTSTITGSIAATTLNGGGQTFYNVTRGGNLGGTGLTINGANTFNNLTIGAITTPGVRALVLSANQTINGTLTLSAGTDATYRSMVQSSVIGTPITLTCNAVSLTDTDFRDIVIAGAAAPASGTRLGDCKGNTGITFVAGVNKYWNLAAGGNWSDIGWATTGGGTPAINNFPLPQDTAIFQSTGLNSGATVTINAGYNIGTIDMSARTSNTMTLATSTFSPTIYGNWINGTGVTLSGTGILIFAGRGSQTITNAGITWTQPITINSPSGSVTLQDAFNSSVTTTSTSAGCIVLSNGTFSANNYNVTLAGGFTAGTVANNRTLNFGSGTWSIAASGGNICYLGINTNLSILGTGTISLTSATAKTFATGGVNCSGITLNQGGAGTLTITGNNTFANITNTNTTASTIALGATTQTVGRFSASGTAGNLLTITGSSAASPATLVFNGLGINSQDYIVPTFIRAYNLSSIWYAGTHSTNGGTLGYIFSAPIVSNGGNFFLMFG